MTMLSCIVKAMVSLTKGEGYGRPLLEFTLVKKPLICSPDTFPNFASFVYVLFHELKHEQQMSEFDQQ